MSLFRNTGIIYPIFLSAAMALTVPAASGQSVDETFSHKPGYTPSGALPPRSIEVRVTPEEIVIEKELLYDNHTLEDVYPYGNGERRFQWDKIKAELDHIEHLSEKQGRWGILQNYKNLNKEADLVKEFERNDYNRVSDMFGIERYQSVALYHPQDTTPTRYGRDGSLVRIISETEDYYLVENVNFSGEWLVLRRYLRPIEATTFDQAIFVDRVNQNICTLDKSGSKWLVRSMNPATTGLHRPMYQHETPKGIFVMQEKKPKMVFLKDGSSETGGYAPWASRFCNGGYVHGVPVNVPATQPIEFIWTLGTTPRSHMCIRNATSHAEFVYNWEKIGNTLLVVFD